ncbi:MAG TPA: aquaporin, partial [Candidatus Dormibacteraeota bacterium]|nr:aquaporin [Candidatus Dormibacteraeota bacterium]
MDLRKALAELIGTFLFFTIGMTAIQAVGALQAPVMVVVPFAFGFGLLAAIFAVGHISGGHFNPAVTIAMTLDGRTTPLDAVAYVVAQVVGAIGSAVLVLVLFSQDAVKATITAPGHGFDDPKALVLETVLTAGFVLVILASTRRASTLAALAIPLTLVAIHFAAIPFSGASVNPVRSLAPALVGGDPGHLW